LQGFVNKSNTKVKFSTILGLKISRSSTGAAFFPSGEEPTWSACTYLERKKEREREVVRVILYSAPDSKPGSARAQGTKRTEKRAAGFLGTAAVDHKRRKEKSWRG
jgi:hypothetical protein